jgi:hypothetical protein
MSAATIIKGDNAMSPPQREAPTGRLRRAFAGVRAAVLAGPCPAGRCAVEWDRFPASLRRRPKAVVEGDEEPHRPSVPGTGMAGTRPS